MHWLIQRKFDYDPKFRELLGNLERLSIPHTYCKVIPFTDDGIEYEAKAPDPSVPVFTCGSYTLAKIAAKHYKPGAFVSKELGMNHLLDNYGDEMFNHDLKFGKVKDVKFSGEVFIRPVEDTKSFTGQKMTYEDFSQWRERIEKMNGDDYKTISLDTEICYASIKPIDKEVRFFIVDGKIATCSEYKIGGQVKYSSNVDEYIKYYVAGMVGDPGFCIGAWQPDKAFVLDVAVTDGVCKILEANCINAVGMYAIDTQKLIMAIEDLTYEYK